MNLLTASLLLCFPAVSAAGPQTFEVTVQAGKYDRANDPVTVVVILSEVLAKGPFQLSDSTGKGVPCQMTEPSVLARLVRIEPGAVQRELHFILPSLKAGETARYKLTVGGAQLTPEAGFGVSDKPGEPSEILWKGRPILRYMNQPLDESTKEAREQTFKVYHHLYDPAGKRLVTKGPGGQYTHHRGLFYGFNKVTYGEDGKKCDIWHCPIASQQHEKVLSTETGPVLARQKLQIGWHGVGKEVFAREIREMTVYNVPGGTLLEFASLLRTTDGPIKLDGDPQHAGFHFRADNEVSAKTSKQTIYIRPDGVGKPGETRNWDPKTKQGPVNLPWNAMSFVLGQERFTAAYLDKPSNPKEARFSERDYGRFGSYFEYEVTRDKPLKIDYRIWLQEGQMKPEAVEALSRDFVEPVTATVK